MDWKLESIIFWIFLSVFVRFLLRRNYFAVFGYTVTSEISEIVMLWKYDSDLFNLFGGSLLVLVVGVICVVIFFKFFLIINLVRLKSFSRVGNSFIVFFSILCIRFLLLFL